VGRDVELALLARIERGVAVLEGHPPLFERPFTAGRDDHPRGDVDRFVLAVFDGDRNGLALAGLHTVGCNYSEQRWPEYGVSELFCRIVSFAYSCVSVESLIRIVVIR
jgi:hypothetical protein